MPFSTTRISWCDSIFDSAHTCEPNGVSSILPKLEPSYHSTVETENLPLSKHYTVNKYWTPYFLFTEGKNLRASNNNISGWSQVDRWTC